MKMSKCFICGAEGATHQYPDDDRPTAIVCGRYCKVKKEELSRTYRYPPHDDDPSADPRD